MSDDQQPEDLRPIPDGGLKDTMPGWLKRPPAWRSMPTAEQRHERTLPEPDTSEIDPKSLVDVSDLPKWLQTIAARGEIPVPEPDQTVGHALQQLQAASARSRKPAREVVDPAIEEPPVEAPAEDPVTVDVSTEDQPGETAPEASAETPAAQESGEPESPPMSTTLVIGICVLIMAVILAAYFFI